MSVLRSGITIAFFTLLSRIFGLFRELTLAYFFGSSKEADCINIALKFPNLFRRIFGEGAFASVFVPIYNRKMNESKEQAQTFAGQILSLLLCILICITISMQIFMPQMMLLLAPGFYQSPDKFKLAVVLCQITMPYLIFISVAAMFGGMLNTIMCFKAFAATPIILNIVIIITCLLTATPTTIAWSIILSGLLQVLFMYYHLKKNSLHFTPQRKMLSDDNKHLMKQMLPAIFSAGLMQISLFISQSIASFIDGAISIIGYAERIYQFPLSLIGTAFGTVLLPTLSKFYAQKNVIAAQQTQKKSLQLGLLISAPAAVGIYFLSNLIIHIVYQRGAFSANDTATTASCLAYFSLGLPAFILNKILTPIFYANDDQNTPFKITFYSLAANVILNIIFMYWFGVAGIAMGSSLSAWFNCYLLIQKLQNRAYFKIDSSMLTFALKLLLSNIIIGVCIMSMKSLIGTDFYQNTLLIKALILLSIIVFSALTYTFTVFSCGIVSKQDLLSLAKK